MNSSGTRIATDMIMNSNIQRVQCDGNTIFINTKDWQSRNYDVQIAYSDIVKYTYLGTETQLPTLWTIYDNIQTQLVTQAAHP